MRMHRFINPASIGAALAGASLLIALFVQSGGVTPAGASNSPSDAAGSLRLTLPPPTGVSRPFRIYKEGADCSAGLCFVRIFKVPAGKLLEIDHLSCDWTNGSSDPDVLVISTTNPAIEFVAFVLATEVSTNNPVAVAAGPFFFAEGEKVFVHAPGTGSLRCAVSGLISAT